MRLPGRHAASRPRGPVFEHATKRVERVTGNVLRPSGTTSAPVTQIKSPTGICFGIPSLPIARAKSGLQPCGVCKRSGDPVRLLTTMARTLSDLP